VYLQSASSSNVIIGKEYLGSLEERLVIAEADIKQLQANQSRPIRQLRFDEDEQRGQENGIETPERNRPGRPRNDGTEVNSDDVDVSSLEDETDGMGAIVFSAEENCAFFGKVDISIAIQILKLTCPGPSSNIAFTRHISRAVAQVTNISQSWFTAQNQNLVQFDAGVMSVSQLQSSPGQLRSNHASKDANRTNINIYTLPPESKVRELLALYFSNTGLLFPYIHRETFLETYEQMKRNDFTKVRRTWLGLLNIVMALTTSTKIRQTMSAEKRAEESEIYYQRAKGLCDKHIMRGTSLEIGEHNLSVNNPYNLPCSTISSCYGSIPTRHTKVC
jgi:hypothetical protein